MNIFGSVFGSSDDADHAGSVSGDDDDVNDLDHRDDAADESDEPAEAGASGSVGGWSFGGLIRSLATKSESVIETYRRDLGDLGSGLRKETEAIRAVAARVVRDLPSAIEAGAAVASDSLESVGQAVDDLGDSVWRSTTEIISQGRDVLGAAGDDGAGNDGGVNAADLEPSYVSLRAPAKRYTRFESQVLMLRSDPNTFAEAPEDGAAFESWSARFRVENKEEEIAALLKETPAVTAILEGLVPAVVDYDTFWRRYFFRLDKLRQVEDVRSKLVNRVKADEENLSWDIEDDDGNDGDGDLKKDDAVDSSGQKGIELESIKDGLVGEIEQESLYHRTAEVNEDPNLGDFSALDETEQDRNLVISGEAVGDKAVESLGRKDDLSEESSKKSEAKANEPSKERKSSVVPVNQPSAAEEEFGWDEIQDVGYQDSKQPSSLQMSSSSSHKAGLPKRTNTAQDDEDLSWDVEDEDESK